MIKIGGSKDSNSALLTYPGLACQGEHGWRIHVSGLTWQTPIVFNMRQRMMIRMLGGVMQATPDQMSGEMFQSRITPFMAESVNRQSVVVTINGRKHQLRKRTRRNGHFFDWIHVRDSDVQQAIDDSTGPPSLKFTVSIQGREGKSGNGNDKNVRPQVKTADGLIYLHQKTGLSVISDIDDTIKDSGVGDRRELLANTFLREFRSIDGMAEVYRQWESEGARFHYVSSSPWQLYSALQQMNTDHGFPLGTMHLRNFRLRDQLLKRVIIRRKGKATAIRLLMKNMPGRDFVLVGDSGEKDPKIYLKICREFPGRIAGVFIREVEHRPLDIEVFRKLQQATRGGICGRFSTAQELREVSAGLLAPAAAV